MINDRTGRTCAPSRRASPRSCRRQPRLGASAPTWRAGTACRVRGGMPRHLHQRREGRSVLRRRRQSQVTQVVSPGIGAPHAVEGKADHLRVGGKRQRPSAGPRLRGVGGERAGQASVHPQDSATATQVQVGQAKGRDLAGPQSGEAGDEDEGAAARRHLLRQPADLLGGQNRALRRARVASAGDSAGVGREDVVVDCRLQDGSEQPVGPCDGGRPVASGLREARAEAVGQAQVPAANIVRFDLVEHLAAQDRLDVQPEVHLVLMPGRGLPPRTALDPPGAVVAEGARHDPRRTVGAEQLVRLHCREKPPDSSALSQGLPRNWARPLRRSPCHPQCPRDLLSDVFAHL